MIEAKLHRASLNLPEPSSNFSIIEAKAYLDKRDQSVSSRRYCMITAILICAILLMGSAVIAATTEADYSAWATSSKSFSDVTKIADRFGVVLPTSLDDSPFYNVTTMYVVPKGTTYLEALSNPAYPWHSVDYGIQDVVREYNSNSPDSGYSESSVVYDEYSISFGSTDNELFKYVFSLDESERRILDDALPGSYHTEEYHGVTMQIVTNVQSDEENDSKILAYHHRVIWVDVNNHAVFSLHKSFCAEENSADQIPNEMIDFAKEIIDLNSR